MLALAAISVAGALCGRRPGERPAWASESRRSAERSARRSSTAAGAGASPGWSRWASSSSAVDQARSGRGRTRAAASTAKRRVAPESASSRGAERVRLRGHLGASRPHGITTTTSGSAAVELLPGRRPGVAPARPPSARCRPPASIISGTQWPATYGGSSHSRASTRGRGAADDRVARAIEPRAEARPEAAAPRPVDRRSPRRAGPGRRARREAARVEGDHVRARLAGARPPPARRRRRRRTRRTAPG